MRLIDADELKGCAIIRPMTHEEFEHIHACQNLIAHNTIPTAYDVEAVVEQLKKLLKYHYEKNEMGEVAGLRVAIDIIKKGGVK